MDTHIIKRTKKSRREHITWIFWFTEVKFGNLISSGLFIFGYFNEVCGEYCTGKITLPYFMPVVSSTLLESMACYAGLLLAPGRPTVFLLHTNHPNWGIFMPFFQRANIFFGYSYSENKNMSENSIARDFNGRMSTFMKIMKSWWNIHVFEQR